MVFAGSTCDCNNREILGNVFSGARNSGSRTRLSDSVGLLLKSGRGRTEVNSSVGCQFYGLACSESLQ